jgi:2'-5' RNA ligase
MKRRLFVAINLPREIKQKLETEVEKLKKLFMEAGFDIRFLLPENWHLTISFLGYQIEEDLNSIIEATQMTVKKFENPKIEFEKINYGPPDKPPRMIWLVGSKETSQKLTLIKDFLEKELINRGVRLVRREYRLFNSHLTLAKFELSRKSLPPIEKSFSHKFEAKSLDLMESHLKRTGAEYEILARFDFRLEKD